MLLHLFSGGGVFSFQLMLKKIQAQAVLGSKQNPSEQTPPMKDRYFGNGSRIERLPKRFPLLCLYVDSDDSVVTGKRGWIPRLSMCTPGQKTRRVNMPHRRHERSTLVFDGLATLWFTVSIVIMDITGLQIPCVDVRLEVRKSGTDGGASILW
jgi:hypothetical protein